MSHRMETEFNKPESSIFSLSTYLTVQNTNYRNCEGVAAADLDTLERIGRRVVGELGYAALIVVSLIEAALRGVFFGVTGIIYVLFAILSEEPPKELLAVSLLCGGNGAIISLGNALCCTIALLRNIFERTVPYENLLPPFTYAVETWIIKY